MNDLGWLISGGLALIGFGVGAWFRFGPGARIGAVADAILGTPDVKDRRGGILAQGSPGLVQRVSTLETVIAQLADQDSRIAALERSHEHTHIRVTVLEDARVERIVAQAESAQMWRSVADKDTIDGEAD